MLRSSSVVILAASVSFCAAPVLSAPRPQDAPVIAAVLDAAMMKDPASRLRVWVFFTDKDLRGRDDFDRRLAARTDELPARTLQRRALRGTNVNRVDVTDLALVPEYIRDVLATGVTARRESRWLNAVSVEAAPAQIRRIAALPFVRRVQPVARAARRLPMPDDGTTAGAHPPLDKGRAGVGSSRGTPAWYGASYLQLDQIGVTAAHDAGYTGSGILIGILDTGFNRTHNAFNQVAGGAHPVQIIAEHDYVSDDGDTTQQPGDFDGQSAHGTYILGTMGAFYPTVLVGAAYNASFILAKTEDISQEVPAEEDDYVAGLEWIESLGADLATSSLGYIDWYTQSDLDGQTAVTTIAVNIATANGLVCCTAAGNEGHDASPATSALIAPADALKVLTCGAVGSDGVIAGFSSDGPTFDGRVKPEVLARGVDTQTVRFSSNTEITGVSGTSLSTPLVAGGVALIIQAHPDWSVDKIRRSLFHTAADFEANAAFDAEYVRGYGVIDVMAAIGFVHSDVNGDGAADAGDIAPFIAALLGTNPDANELRRADIDASGSVTESDVPIFVTDLLGI